MSMIEMVVDGIGIDPKDRPLVLLRDEERTTFVPIYMGLPEVTAIQMELENKQNLRPMTHDLINNIFRDLDIRLVKVTVNDCEGLIHYASLHLQIGNDTITLQEVDARPSDAIALALRAQCQILVSTTVTEKVGIQLQETDSAPAMVAEQEEEIEDSPADVEKFSRLLEGVDLGEPDPN